VLVYLAAVIDAALGSEVRVFGVCPESGTVEWPRVGELVGAASPLDECVVVNPRTVSVVRVETVGLSTVTVTDPRVCERLP
jgi:hypothetical protein